MNRKFFLLIKFTRVSSCSFVNQDSVEDSEAEVTEEVRNFAFKFPASFCNDYVLSLIIAEELA